jgi:hypothetical protein
MKLDVKDHLPALLKSHGLSFFAVCLFVYFLCAPVSAQTGAGPGIQDASVIIAESTSVYPGNVTPSSDEIISSNGFISIDPIADHFLNESFAVTGTTNISAGMKLLVEAYSPDHTLEPRGTFYSGTVGKVIIKEGPGGNNSWTYTIDPAGWQPGKYVVVVSSYGPEPSSERLFYLYEKSSETTNVSSVAKSSPLPSSTSRSAPVQTCIPVIAFGICSITMVLLRRSKR